jgi:hypothetical protein
MLTTSILVVILICHFLHVDVPDFSGRTDIRSTSSLPVSLQWPLALRQAWAEHPQSRIHSLSLHARDAAQPSGSCRRASSALKPQLPAGSAFPLPWGAWPAGRGQRAAGPGQWGRAPEDRAEEKRKEADSGLGPHSLPRPAGRGSRGFPSHGGANPCYQQAPGRLQHGGRGHHPAAPDRRGRNSGESRGKAWSGPRQCGPVRAFVACEEGLLELRAPGLHGSGGEAEARWGGEGRSQAAVLAARGRAWAGKSGRRTRGRGDRARPGPGHGFQGHLGDTGRARLRRPGGLRRRGRVHDRPCPGPRAARSTQGSRARDARAAGK